MRIISFLSILICFIIPLDTIATGGNPHFGGRSAGLGNATVALKDLWAIKHNQAGLAFIDKIQVGAAYESRFTLRELSSRAGVAAIPVKLGTFGVNVSQFGYSQYNENKFGLAFAKKLSKGFAIGVQLNYQYFQFGASEYGQKGFVTGEVGVMADVNKNLTLGAHVFNPGYTKVAEFDDERIPVILRIGADYKFSNKFHSLIEVEKDIDQDAQVKLGGEYKAHDKIFLRAGLSTDPFQNSFGVGFYYGGLRLDVSTAYHSTLGYSPNVSLTYQFK